MNPINPVTRTDITSMADRNDYISLIKALRQKTGNGLKEAKYAIDKCITSTLENQVKVFDINKLLTEFGFRVNRDKLLAAVSCALDHYETLGFISELEAVQSVVNNFYSKAQDNG